jgi:alkanesulfonate monooxygenase SsuD/methylene tetrahydromethanopterin reductase-like flavin-dependent oxidoreductase (luciferase family)
MRTLGAEPGGRRSDAGQEKSVKFSMIFEAQTADASRKSEFQIMHDCVEQAVLAEEQGFDRVWAVEHHCLQWYAHMSAPETFLAYVAGRTSRIRIGHGVVCLPFRMNHPVKVAERVAMLDILSKGRVDFGIGKGGTIQEAGAFQTEMEEIPGQLEESGRMIPRMWQSEYFEHRSERMELPRRPIIPKPHQDPHPPMYLACTRETTLNQAGEWGLGALVLGFAGPDDIEQKNRVYRAAVKRRTPMSQMGAFPVEHLSALCPAIVLDDGAKARAVGHRGQRFFTEAIRHWYNPGPDAPPPRAEIADMDDAEVLRQQGEQLVAYLHEEKIEVGTEATGLFNPNHAYGTAKDAIGYCERLVEAGADEIMFLIQMGTVPQDAALETIRNLGRHVLPHFRSV